MSEQEIFDAAMGIADAKERLIFVVKACAGDAELKRQVESLLAAHQSDREFLDVPALQQLGATIAQDLNSPDATRGGCDVPQSEFNLSFLQASNKPDSLGRLGHYEVLEVLGRGGYGIVLKAFDDVLHRTVAIKVMAPEIAVTSPARKRFLREARAAAAIRHENVVSIHAVEDQPIPFLVMEYIAGPTLQQHLDGDGPFELHEIVRIGRQIAHGLEAAHAMGIVHRDIKPGNILLEKGRDRVKITDFGLARAGDDASQTQSGVISGTPLYMSPEQAQGKTVDARSDLFSLGSVLYVMCTGRPPFRAGTTLAVLNRVVEDQPRPIHEIIPEVPDWLASLIARLHVKNPGDRFASAAEVARHFDDCEKYLHNREAPAPRIELQPATAAPSRQSQRLPWPVAIATLLTVVVGLAVLEAVGITNLGVMPRKPLELDGTVVVEMAVPDAIVKIDGRILPVPASGILETRLKQGSYRLEASRGGLPVHDEIVTVTANGRHLVRISMNPPIPPATSRLGAQLVFYDTFDDPQSTTVFQGMRNGAQFSVEDGLYRIVQPNGSTSPAFATNIGPPIGDHAFTIRMRTENAITNIAFRHYLRPTHGNWLYLRINANGRWMLYRNNMTIHNGKRVDKPVLLAESEVHNPSLSAGQWITISVQTTGSDYEVWLNGQSVARGTDETAIDSEPSTIGYAVQLASWQARSGPVRLDLDYAAIWDTTPIEPPKSP